MPTDHPVNDPHSFSLASFQQLIRDMYLKKDIARGVDGTFMWLIEEVGELAGACAAARMKSGSANSPTCSPGWPRSPTSSASISAKRSPSNTAQAAPAAGNSSAPAPMRRSHELPSNRDRFRVRLVLLVGRAHRECEPLPTRHPRHIDAIEVGFAGHYKSAIWTPVTVTLSAGSHDVRGDLEVVVPDGDGVRRRECLSGACASAGEKKGTPLFVKFGRPHAAIAVTLRGAMATVLAERVFSGDEVPAALAGNSKSGGTKLILEMGSSLEYGSAIRFSEEGNPEETAVVHLTEPSQWPDRSDGYDGVDYIVMTTGEPKIYSQIKPAAYDALDRWLHLGGRMLISVGRNGQELLGSGMPLARFAPGRFATVESNPRFFGPWKLCGHARAARISRAERRPANARCSTSPS